MGEFTTGHVLLDAVLIVVMVLVLDWSSRSATEAPVHDQTAPDGWTPDP